MPKEEKAQLSAIMHDIIPKLKNYQECVNLAKNATKNGNLELALEAQKRGIELRAATKGAMNGAERECIEAVFAYEDVLHHRNGKKTKAARTWKMLADRGIIPAVERLVNRPIETPGYQALKEMGLEHYAFESVIIRHPSAFSEEALRSAQERIESASSQGRVLDTVPSP